MTKLIKGLSLVAGFCFMLLLGNIAMNKHMQKERAMEHNPKTASTTGENIDGMNGKAPDEPMAFQGDKKEVIDYSAQAKGLPAVGQSAVGNTEESGEDTGGVKEERNSAEVPNEKIRHIVRKADRHRVKRWNTPDTAGAGVFDTDENGYPSVSDPETGWKGAKKTAKEMSGDHSRAVREVREYNGGDDQIGVLNDIQSTLSDTGKLLSE